MKGFFIEVSNDLLDPRHCKQMGDSVWLFMWFLDKITTITQERGKVLGGKPIKFKEIQADLGVSRSTYMRWLKVLKDGGYVETVRTPWGSCIVVKKAKKRFNRSTSDVSETEHRTSTNDTSLYHKRHKGVSDMTQPSTTNDTSNKTGAVDNTEDNTVDHGPSGLKPLGEEKNSLTILAKKKDSRINDAIALFLPILPGDFTGVNSAFAKTPTRDAVEALLERYSLDELKELIRKYDSKKTDKFRPEVGTVYEFCTFKLAKIESYLVKSVGDLWAHRSISSPEQRASSDAAIKRIIEASREKSRKIEEEWLKNHPEKNNGV